MSSQGFEPLIQQEFDHLDVLYFNSAYFGPSPLRAEKEVQWALEKEIRPFFQSYEEWMKTPEKTRRQFAKLLGAGVDPLQISHATSTSDIINTVVNGYPFKKGDTVCIVDKDYPSNVLPWMLGETRYPFSVRMLGRKREEDPLNVDRLSSSLPKNCRIFNTSYVAFDTGNKIDLVSLGKFCREQEILFVVDATQAFGGMPLTSQELDFIDVLAVSSYKWLLGPYGHAFAYFSQKALNLIRHSSANWLNGPNAKSSHSLTNYTIDSLPGARKYDRGQTSNFLVTACLEGCLQVLIELGLSNIEKHNAEIRDYFLENYPHKKYKLISSPKCLSNIVALQAIKGDSLALEEKLKKQNIDISVREGNLRISFHLFNTKDQVERLIKALS